MDASHQAPEVVPSHEPPQVYYGNKEGDYLHHGAAQSAARPGKRIMGLRKTTFWLLFALLVVVILAAVGGGVGGSLAVKNAKKEAKTDSAKSGDASPDDQSSGSASTSAPPSSSTGGSPTGTTTTSGLYVAPTDAKVSLDCDNKSPSVMVAGKRWNFNATCGINHPKNDLLPIVSYSLTDCLSACAKWNSKWGSGCVGVVFGSDIAGYVKAANGNCFLKNGTSADEKDGRVTSALLLGDDE